MTNLTTRAARGAALVMLALASAGCQGLLDVKNPNNVDEAALENAQAADQMANGVLAATVRMRSAILAPYATATDELDWIGSREAWKDLERGAISNYLNEFTDQAFPFAGEARYLADETIARLEAFDAERRLVNRASLARTYLNAAIIYSSIGDMFDDFAFSNKTEPGPAIGRANMGRMYDTAIGYLDKALAIANTGTDANLRYAILATRARVKHGKAVWTKITPEGTAPANPLVNDPGANADATAALAVLSGADDKYRLKSNIETQPGINIWFEVNGRNEMRVGLAYVNLKDPITGEADPAAAKLVAEFKAYGSRDGVFTIVSDRELRLILAEAALAAGNSTEFAAQVNAVRALDGLPAYTGQVPAVQLLAHMRRANLFLQLRRLADIYRFRETVPEWTTDPNFKSAINTPGLLFPIPNIERLSNPCIVDPTKCS